MSAELLQVMFTCERYRSDFPRGMPVKACLRRQLDRQESTKPGELGPARRPFCAGECSVGAAHRASAEAEGIPLRSCPGCGSALVGADAEPCAACAARRLEEGKDVPRGALPAVGPGVSSRIWSGEVPDVPIGGPGKRRGGGALAARGGPGSSAALREAREERAAARRRELEEEMHHQEEPAEPAKERRMACGECGSKTVHKGWCEKRPGGPMKGPAGKRPEVAAERPGKARAAPTVKAGMQLVASKPAKRPAPARGSKHTEEPDFAYLAEEKTDDLVASVGKVKATLAALRAELLRRKGAIDAAIAEVEEAAA